MKKFLKIFLCITILGVGALITYRALADEVLEILDIGYDEESHNNYILYAKEDGNILNYWGPNDEEIIEVENIITAGFLNTGKIWYLDNNNDLYYISSENTQKRIDTNVIYFQPGYILYDDDNPSEYYEYVYYVRKINDKYSFTETSISQDDNISTNDLLQDSENSIDFVINGETILYSISIEQSNYETTKTLYARGENIFGTNINDGDYLGFEETIFNNVEEYGKNYAISNGKLYIFDPNTDLIDVAYTRSVMFNSNDYWILTNDGINGDLYLYNEGSLELLKENIVYDYNGFSDIEGYNELNGCDVKINLNDNIDAFTITYTPRTPIDDHEDINYVEIYMYDCEEVTEETYNIDYETFEMNSVSYLYNDGNEETDEIAINLLIDNVLYTNNMNLQEAMFGETSPEPVKLLNNIKSIEYIDYGFLITNDNKLLRFGNYEENELDLTGFYFSSYVPVLIKEHNHGFDAEIDPIEIVSFVKNEDDESYYIDENVLFDNDNFDIYENYNYTINSIVIPINAEYTNITTYYDSNAYDFSNNVFSAKKSGVYYLTLSIDDTDFNSTIEFNNYVGGYNSIQIDSLTDKSITSEDPYGYQDITGTYTPNNFANDEVKFQIYYNDEVTTQEFRGYYKWKENDGFLGKEIQFKYDDEIVAKITNYDDDNNQLYETNGTINKGIFFYKPGTYRIVVYSYNNDYIRDEKIIDVAVKTTTIVLNNYKEYFIYGEEENSRQLEWTILPNNATNKDVTFTSSDETVATIDENGLITVLKEGSTNITINSVDGTSTVTRPFDVVKSGGVKGDVTGDNDVTGADLLKIRRFLAGLEETLE